MEPVVAVRALAEGQQLPEWFFERFFLKKTPVIFLKNNCFPTLGKQEFLCTAGALPSPEHRRIWEEDSVEEAAAAGDAVLSSSSSSCEAATSFSSFSSDVSSFSSDGDGAGKETCDLYFVG